MSRSLIIKNAHLVTPLGNSARHGAEMKQLHTVEDAVIAVRDGRIAYVGTSLQEAEQAAGEHQVIDAKGCAVLPGFVDSHTHLTFGGSRPDEFEMRLRGASYMDIMRAGGGIQSTVNATRSATAAELAAKARPVIESMADMGVTTLEGKSGYGLCVEAERTQLEAMRLLSDDPELPLTLVPTFMGAHAVPTEFKGRTADYVDHVISDMLPAFKDAAVFCDVFTEKDVFELDDTRRLLNAAKALGYKVKLHADEIVTLGGAELAAELGATSADHLLHLSDAGIEALAKSDTVATLLPLTAFSLRDSYAPARRMIDAGCAVALATDFNPGSCSSYSVPLMIALAGIYMSMSTEEIVTALTLNGAAALALAEETGSIETGKRADIIVLRTANPRDLLYNFGINQVETVIAAGKVIK
ncbi:MAG: imidazolonepropionase [Muribaculaceae bacterium]|nr:imidazolonepropionase [Muribaculaceae bacterium]